MPKTRGKTIGPRPESCTGFEIPTAAGVRVDSAIDESAVVSPYYDSMLAKVIVHAPTRAEAARRLSRALASARNSRVCAPIASCWCACSSIPSFSAARPTRIFSSGTIRPHWQHRLADAARRASARRRRRIGQRRPTTARRPRVLAHVRLGLAEQSLAATTAALPGRQPARSLVEYAFQRDGLQLASGDGEPLAEVRCRESRRRRRCDCEVDGIERTYDVQQVGDTFYVDSPLGSLDARRSCRDFRSPRTRRLPVRWSRRCRAWSTTSRCTWETRSRPATCCW